MKRTVSIITGSRAEWGLFHPLATEIASRPSEFALKIIAAGAHFSPKHGMTCQEIVKDGFQIDDQVILDMEANDEKGIGVSVGRAVQKFTEVLHPMRPDLVFLLGDRYETFASATACLFLKIAVGHIHGGELTEGSLDDTMRHCITKMALLHFVAAESYRTRVIHLGEDPDRVFNVGALGIDNIHRTRLMNRAEFEEALGIRLGRRNILITYHPPTAASREIIRQEVDCLLKVLGDVQEARLLFTRTNPDMYADEIVERIEDFVAKDTTNRVLFASLGRVAYLSALSLADVVMGNSSSGIIEAPALGVPTVNIGSRQDGRVRAKSIIDVQAETAAVGQALTLALSDEFRRDCRAAVDCCPYGDGTAAQKIANVVAKTMYLSYRKRFYDVF